MTGLSPEAAVDELLAAPPAVTQSESERRKLAARKAHLRAIQEQERASKRTTPPTTEDFLADMLRVAEDPETNPYHADRILSEKRYRRFGHFPIEFIFREFGQFEHAKEVAGLKDKAGTRMLKAAIAARSRHQHAARYAERCLLPYVLRDPEIERDLTGAKLMLTISDTHATFLDPFTWHVFLSACVDLKPDIVCFNGDVLNGGAISRHPNVPGWTIPLQLELDFVRTMFEQARRANPDALILYVNGNHEDNLAKYLTHVAKDLADLRTLKMDKLLGLDDLEINLAMSGNITAPQGREELEPGIVLYDLLHIHHGTILGLHHAAGELKASGRSGVSGHAHRAALAFGTTAAHRSLCWMSLPTGASHRVMRDYRRGKSTTGWQSGCGITYMTPGHVRQYPIITDTVANVEGRIYTRPSDLPDMDVDTNWLEGFPAPAPRRARKGKKGT